MRVYGLWFRADEQEGIKVCITAMDAIDVRAGLQVYMPQWCWGESAQRGGSGLSTQGDCFNGGMQDYLTVGAGAQYNLWT